MKKSRFTEEQMIGMLREADRTSVAAVAKAPGINDAGLWVGLRNLRALSVASYAAT